ncbi:MAG: sensor histidine kinase, partial [Solirubrobacteraceae bacterium]
MTIRLRLTLAFVLAMGVVLAATGAFLYVRFRAGLDGSIDRSLKSETYAVQALISQADSGLQSGGRSLLRSGQSFAEVIVNGRVADRTPALSRTPLLTAPQLTRAARAPLLLARVTRPGLAGPARLLATTVSGQNGRATIVVGVLLRDRDSELATLELLLVLGGSGALALAGVVGYVVSFAALRAVESMRARAATMSVDHPGRRLPLPRSHDELWRLGTTLNEMLARNEAAFARERTFVDDASHELRTPLSILRAELEIALLGEDSAAELREALASAVEETDRLSRMVEDLLILARTDQGKLPMRREALPVSDLLHGICERFRGQAAAAGASITVTAPAGLVIDGDRIRLEQALGNLLDNALRHGKGPIRLSGLRVHDGVELHVIDGGAGIPAAFLERAFERFARADGARTGDGSGLGLAIVRSIAHAHGGEAHAANHASGGADVWLALPDPKPRSGNPAGDPPEGADEP